jgi:alkylation response protein AidB-like acyl-CoA dehydrogenase
MANFYLDNDDLRFYVERGLDWAPLVQLVEQGYKLPDGHKNLEEALTFYKDVLEMVGQFTAEEIAPRAAAIDHAGLKLEDGEVVFPKPLKEIFDQIRGLELHGLCVPRELGGMNAPSLIYMINSEVMGRGDVSVMAHHGFHGGIAMAMLLYSMMEGSTEIDRETGTIKSTRWAREIAEIIAGKAWGCMDITEPSAGSDMGAMRSRGEQDESGQWYVTGEKIFITSGHGKYHFVIARTEEPTPGGDALAGLKGLSLFLVPAYEERDGQRVRLARVDRLEEKLGHHGSATAAIVFDRTPAQLVGKRGEGFKNMLFLMNNARLGVAFEALGLCEAAYRLARDYAAQRPSMGKTIDRHEVIADYLDEMQTDIQGIRAMAMHGAWHEEMTQRLQIQLKHGVEENSLDAQRLKKEIKRHKRAARRVTPLAKYLASERGVEMARRALQIHGGVGYTREYGAEKLLRDALVMPIYEGTSQIQALMAMKDCLGAIIKNPQRFVRRMAEARWRTLSARDPLERRVAKIQSLSMSAQQHLITRTAADKLKALGGRPLNEWPREFLKNWNPKRDFACAMLHAERLTRLLADEAICEILLSQAEKHPDRRDVLLRYLERAEPRARALHDEITTTGERLLAKLAEREDAAERSAG